MSVVQNLLNFYPSDAAAEFSLVNSGGSRRVCNQEQNQGFLCLPETRGLEFFPVRAPLAELDPGFPLLMPAGLGQNFLPSSKLLTSVFIPSDHPVLQFLMKLEDLKVQEGSYDSSSGLFNLYCWRCL